MTVTLDPSKKGSGLALTNGNLTASGSGAYASDIATEGKSSGKWYWEIKLDDWGYQATYWAVGIASSLVDTKAGTYIGDNPNIRAFYISGDTRYGDKYFPGTINVPGNVYTGDIIGIEIDFDLDCIKFFQNGILKYTGTNIKTMGTVYPYVEAYQGMSTFNFGATPFKYKKLQQTSYDGSQQSSQKKNLIDIKQLGDTITCRYKASSGAFGLLSEMGTCVAPEIPVSGTATPDGLLNFIFVGYDTRGRKKLLADRNIQYNIAWNVLNTAGVASGEGLSISGMLGYKTTDVTDGLPQASFLASSEYSSGYGAWRAFDNVWNEVNAGWQSANGANGVGWVQVDLGSGVSKAIAKMDYQADNVLSASHSIKDISVKASNDGINFVTQFVGVALQNDSIQSFFWEPTGSFRYWRIGVDSTFAGTGYIAVSEIALYEKDPAFNPTTMNVNLRLPTGGTANIDYSGFPYVEDEWDKFICDSTLGGKIPPSSNLTWNWSNQYSWSSSSWTSALREARGYSTAQNKYQGINADYVSASIGFRPMLIVEILNQAPTIALETVPPTTLKATLNLKGLITDPDSDTIKYRINSGAWSAQLPSPYSLNEIINLNLGLNTITVDVMDVYENPATVTVSILMQNTVPTLTITKPTFNTITKTSPIIISGDIVDPDAGQIIQYKIENLTKGTVLKDYNLSDTNSFTFSFVADNSNTIANIDNIIKITAKDDSNGVVIKYVNIFPTEKQVVIGYAKGFTIRNLIISQRSTSFMVSTQFVGNAISLYSLDEGLTWKIGKIDDFINIPEGFIGIKLKFLASSETIFKAYGIGWM